MSGGGITRFDRRLRQVEARAASGSQHQPPRWRVWIELSDGRMRGADGEIFPREEFEQRRLGADAIVVLPDNGRDGMQESKTTLCQNQGGVRRGDHGADEVSLRR
jgi:hypothetical protein